MSYHIRYTPAAQKDMDDVRESVLESSKSFDIAGIYVAEFADTVAEKESFPNQEYPCTTGYCLRDSIRLTLWRTKRFTD